MLSEIMTALRNSFPDYNHLLGSKNPEEIPQKEFPFFAYYLQDQKISPSGGSSFEVTTTLLVIIGVRLSSLETSNIENLKEVATKTSKLLLEKGFTKDPIEVEFVYRFPNLFAVLKLQTTERI